MCRRHFFDLLFYHFILDCCLISPPVHLIPDLYFNPELGPLAPGWDLECVAGRDQEEVRGAHLLGIIKKKCLIIFFNH